jgi:hypothetical protein
MKQVLAELVVCLLVITALTGRLLFLFVLTHRLKEVVKLITSKVRKHSEVSDNMWTKSNKAKT